jgi:hypothetical protein
MDSSMKNVRSIPLKEIHGIGFTISSLVTKLVQLDYKLIPNLNYDSEGSPEDWIEITKKYPDSLVLMINNENKIIGYLRFVAMKKKYFEIAKTGAFPEGLINIETLDDINKPGRYFLYIIMIGIIDEMQHKGFLHPLLNAFFTRIEELEQKGVYFSEIGANAYTSAGLNVLQRLGLKKTAPCIAGGEMHFCDFDSFWKNRKSLG